MFFGEFEKPRGRVIDDQVKFAGIVQELLGRYVSFAETVL